MDESNHHIRVENLRLTRNTRLPRHGLFRPSTRFEQNEDKIRWLELNCMLFFKSNPKHSDYLARSSNLPREGPAAGCLREESVCAAHLEVRRRAVELMVEFMGIDDSQIDFKQRRRIMAVLVPRESSRSETLREGPECPVSSFTTIFCCWQLDWRSVYAERPV